MNKKRRQKIVNVVAGVITFLITIVCCQLAPDVWERYKDSRSKQQVQALVEAESIFRASLLLTRLYYPDINEVEAIRIFDATVSEIEELVQGVQDPCQVVDTINSYLFGQLKIGSAGGALDVSLLLPDQVLKSKKGNCVSLSLLYLAVAEELGLPMFARVVPGHVFVCFDDSSQRFNVETTAAGKDFADSHYKNMLIDPDQPHSKFYLRILSKAEAVATFLSNLGGCLKAEGRRIDALDAYKKALFLAPESPEICHNVGAVYLRLGERNKAKKYLMQAASMDPALWTTHSVLAKLHVKNADCEQAVGEYLKAIELLHSKITINARVRGFSGDEDLLETVRETLGQVDASYSRLLGLGIWSFRNTHYQLADRLFRRAAQLRLEDANVLAFLAATNFHLQNYELAREYSHSADEKLGYCPARGTTFLISQVAKLYAELGKSYGSLRQYDKSIEAVEKAIEIGGPKAGAYGALATTYSLMGDKSKVTELCEKALEIDPSYEWARKRLSELTK
ncbi:MAG: transglutaminase family protein [Planctomycetota bacterium]|jgi:tetratricopeptide (TPR) repeat protein